MALDAYLNEYGRRDWEETDGEEGTVRVAMVGLGWWTRDRAIPAVEAEPRCETTVVVSGSTEKGEALVAEHDSIERALTYEEFLDGAAADAYDAAYVATPNARHLDLVEAAAREGKAILCEKPMEASVERAKRMVETCGETGATLMIAYRMQTEPAVRRMRELIRDGAIGDPAQVHAHMSQPLLEMIPDPDQWRLDPGLAGPGASVTDLGIYPLNTTRFVLDADPVAVQSSLWSGDEAFEKVPDERAAFRVEFPGGVFASCSASQNAADAGFLRVVGTEGQLLLEPTFSNEAPTTLTLERGDRRAEITSERVDQMRKEFAYFADRLLAGRDPHPDGRHGLVDMRAIEAVYESGGERIELDGDA